jgi:DNA topoisomerase-1
VATRPGNTPTICRKCYIHPEIITCFIEGCLVLEVKAKARPDRGISRPWRPEGAAVLALLQRRLSLPWKTNSGPA